MKDNKEMLIEETKQELISSGRVMLSDDKHEKWKQIVNEVAIDKNGIKVIKNIIHIISVLNHGGTPEAAFKLFRYQSHSGQTEELERNIILNMANNGEGFYEVAKDFKSNTMGYKRR